MTREEIFKSIYAVKADIAACQQRIKDMQKDVRYFESTLKIQTPNPNENRKL